MRIIDLHFNHVTTFYIGIVKLFTIASIKRSKADYIQNKGLGLWIKGLGREGEGEIGWFDWLVLFQAKLGPIIAVSYI